MKRIIGFLLAMVLGLALVGCSTSRTSHSSDSSSSTSAASSSSSSSAKKTNGKVLVAYYSASGTTKDIAEKIADATGGTLFEITPVNTYSDDDLDWTNDDSRVNKEHNSTKLQDQVKLKTTTVKNWKNYDTVFLGYPIWWGAAAWPVRGFVKANSFSGKTVIPFCTSSSSEIGTSGTDLKKLTKGGSWQTGHRFGGGDSASDVKKWVDSLDLD